MCACIAQQLGLLGAGGHPVAHGCRAYSCHSLETHRLQVGGHDPQDLGINSKLSHKNAASRPNCDLFAVHIQHSF